MLIGANDYGFADIVQTCVTDWLTSPSWWKNYCQDDSNITAMFTSSNITTVTNNVRAAYQRVQEAMSQRAATRRARTSCIAQTYSAPIPKANGFRYGQTGFTRQTIGGCGVWNRDADWARDTVVNTLNSTTVNAVRPLGLPVLDMDEALAGRKLCENTVGLLEERGIANWRSAGAADNTEWVQQIRTLTTLFPPYQLQEDAHPNYWGQLALRNCFRQAYYAGRGGTCSRGLGAQRQRRAEHGVRRRVRRLAVAAVLLFAGLCARADAAAPVLRPLRRRDVRFDRAPARQRAHDRRRVPLVRADAASGPPLVAVEGGPGYPSTGSRWEYRGIFGPLIPSRGLLLMDQRGTGDSALIDCKSVQGFAGRTSGRAFARRVGRCAAEIDARYGRGAHSYFATAYAADDLAAVLRALKLGKVDLYGDSYGTFFVQEFIARHPCGAALGRAGLGVPAARPRPLVRVLGRGGAGGAGDGLAGVGGAARRSCWRGCARRRSWARPATPTRACCRACASIRGCSPTWSRTARRTRSPCASSTRPCARRWRATTSRCCGSRASRASWNHSPGDAAYFSRGAYLAVSCLDYPRLTSFAGAPEAFAPFTAAEWLTISGFSQPYDVCLDWPASKAPAARCRP